MVVEVLEDAGAAYAIWVEEGVRKAVCLHADRELDASDEGIPRAGRERLERRRRGEAPGERYWWSGIHHGNYLLPALVEGVVDHLVWLVPEPMGVEALREALQGLLDLHLAEYRSFRRVTGRVEGTLAGARLTVCTAEALPRLSNPVLLDIDLSWYLDSRDRLARTPFDLRRALGGLEPRLVTVGRSVESGQVPAELGFLAELTERAFRDPAGPWEERLRRFLDGEEVPGLESPPSSSLARGAFWYRRGEARKAEEWLERAARESPPDEPFCRLLLGMLARDGGNHEAAAQHWKALPQDHRLPAADRAQVGALLCTSHLELDQPEEAEAAIREALRLDPDHPGYHHQLGRALARQGRHPEAIRALRRSLRLGPDRLGSLAVHRELAELYQRCGQSALARAEHRRLRQKDVTGLYRLRSLLEEGRPD